MVRTTLASLVLGVLVLSGAAMAWGQSTDERPTIGGILAERLGLRPTRQKKQTTTPSKDQADGRLQARSLIPRSLRPRETERVAQQVPSPRTGSPSRFGSRGIPTEAVPRSSRRRADSNTPAEAGRTNPLPRGIDSLRKLPNSNSPASTTRTPPSTTRHESATQSTPSVPRESSADSSPKEVSETHVSDIPKVASRRGAWQSSSIQARLSTARAMDLETTAVDALPSEERPATTQPAISAPNSVEERNSRHDPSPTKHPAPRVADRRATPAATASQNVLISHKSPVLSVETVGPSRVLIGREAKYTVVLKNAGSVGANGVQVTVSVPDGCDVVGFEPTIGTTHDPQAPERRGVVWLLEQLPGGQTAELDVRIVPHDSRPFDLGVQWTYSSQATQTLVEVQEPKLTMSLSGPDEVAYGRPVLYKLTISNPGTGVTENVVVRLLPTLVGTEAMPSHRVGNLTPGETTSIDLELTARESGQLAIKAEATAEGGLQANIDEEVLVRKPEVALELVGPRFLYAGTAATYTIRVTNPGNAPAKNVTIEALVPSSGEFVTSTHGGEFDQASRKVTWLLAALPADSHRDFEFKCVLNNGGVIKQQVSATGDDDVHDQQIVTTQVEALADLVLDVVDPKGPVPIAEETVYEIHVRNRGTDVARGIEVVAFFSEGLEAVAVEGGGHEIGPGQVLMHPIETLDPGREIVFKVRARADTTGNHIFRAEVRCESLDTRLAVEETTRFYGQPATAAVNQPNQPARLIEQPAEPSPRVAEPSTGGRFK